MVPPGHVFGAFPFSVAAYDLLDAQDAMRASQTQIDAYHGMSSKQLSAKQQMVLNVFESDLRVTLTREDISARTNLKLSSVCGRVHELVKAGQLAVRGTVKCVATGNRQQLIGLPTGAGA